MWSDFRIEGYRSGAVVGARGCPGGSRTDPPSSGAPRLPLPHGNRTEQADVPPGCPEWHLSQGTVHDPVKDGPGGWKSVVGGTDGREPEPGHAMGMQHQARPMH